MKSTSLSLLSKDRDPEKGLKDENSVKDLKDNGDVFGLVSPFTFLGFPEKRVGYKDHI